MCALGEQTLTREQFIATGYALRVKTTNPDLLGFIDEALKIAHAKAAPSEPAQSPKECPRCVARRKAKAETMKRYRRARKGEGEAS